MVVTGYFAQWLYPYVNDTVTGRTVIIQWFQLLVLLELLVYDLSAVASNILTHSFIIVKGTATSDQNCIQFTGVNAYI